MLGYSLEEALTLNLVDWDAPWTPAELDQTIAESDLHLNTFETRYRRKDGSLCILEISANHVNWDGQRLQFCICRDISDRKAIELALQEREARLQRLAANIAGMLYQYVLYADGCESFTYVSSKCREIYELEPEKLQQDFGQVWAMIHPEDVERVRQVNRNSAQRLERFDVEFRLLINKSSIQFGY